MPRLKNVKLRVMKLLSKRQFTVMNRVELSRDALLHNLRLLTKISDDKSCIPVLKANAYGHGLVEVVRILANSGAKLVAVDGYHEALTVRKTNTRQRILVMGAIDPANFAQLRTEQTSFVAHDFDSLAGWAATRRKVNLHLEFNTGMNRQGFNESDLPHIIELIHQHPQLKVEGIMSHLADADNATSESFTTKQAQQFDAIVKICLENGLTPKYIHLGQSAGLTKVHSCYANAIRPGIALYGINPLSKNDKKFEKLEQTKPVLRLISRVGEIRELSVGEGISYNITYKASQPTKIAVIPLGYYEALPRTLSNKAKLSVKGVPCPILGRVCMNHTMIDVTGLEVSVGDEVEVISDQRKQPNSLQSLADQTGLLNYEFMVHINSSIRRVIID